MEVKNFDKRPNGGLSYREWVKRLPETSKPQRIEFIRRAGSTLGIAKDYQEYKIVLTINGNFIIFNRTDNKPFIDNVEKRNVWKIGRFIEDIIRLDIEGGNNDISEFFEHNSEATGAIRKYFPYYFVSLNLNP